MIIAIDGPAGSGKSSTARAVAAAARLPAPRDRRLLPRHHPGRLRAGIPPEKWGELTGADLDKLGFEARPDRLRVPLLPRR